MLTYGIIPLLGTQHALVDTAHPDHIQKHILSTALLALFDTSDESCQVLYDPIDFEQAAAVIADNQHLHGFGVVALTNALNACIRRTERGDGFLHSFLSEQAHKFLREREDGQTEWRRSFGKAAVDWDAIPAHLTPRLVNEQRGQIELYEWEHNPPTVGEQYNFYTDWPNDPSRPRAVVKDSISLLKLGTLKTWMGDTLLKMTEASWMSFWPWGQRDTWSGRKRWVKAIDMHGHIWRGLAPAENGVCCTMRRIK